LHRPNNFLNPEEYARTYVL